MRARPICRADLDLLLHDRLRVVELCDRRRYAEHDRDTVDAVVDLAAQVATEYVAPHRRRGRDGDRTTASAPPRAAPRPPRSAAGPARVAGPDDRRRPRCRALTRGHVRHVAHRPPGTGCPPRGARNPRSRATARGFRPARPTAPPSRTNG
ncbi:hypothetical protein [Pseudonocardia tropica]|uniref:hypothetical protein n=1 Tax=Pseudonocardia tropica TaxID=681289 RepID=UPI0031ECF215